MKRAMACLVGWLLANPVVAHHTRDHMMLAGEATRVIAETRQGAENGLGWVVWTALILLLVPGVVRIWRGRR